MAIFRRRNDERELALDRALGRIYEAQSKQVEALTAFLAQIAELSSRKMAQALGSRGGKKRAANAVIAKKATGCPLCIDPNRRDVTNEMISRHREHGAPSPSLPNGIDKEES